MLKIDDNKCNACGLCEKTCPFGAIAVEDDSARSNESCTLCGACVNVCPQGALTIERKQASPEELAQYKGVYVWAECEPKGESMAPKRVVYELLTQGRVLADKLGQELVAVALGDSRMTGLESLCEQGADRVLRCEHELLGSLLHRRLHQCAFRGDRGQQAHRLFVRSHAPTAATWLRASPPACAWV